MFIGQQAILFLAHLWATEEYFAPMELGRAFDGIISINIAPLRGWATKLFSNY